MMKQEMLKQLNMPEYSETGDEFIEAELEMLAMGAKNIPQGSALGGVASSVGVHSLRSACLAVYYALSSPFSALLWIRSVDLVT